MNLYGLFQLGGVILVVLTILVLWSELRTRGPRDGPELPQGKRKFLKSSYFSRDLGLTEKEWSIPSDPKEYTKAMMPSSAKKDTFK